MTQELEQLKNMNMGMPDIYWHALALRASVKAKYICKYTDLKCILQAYDPHEGKDNERRLTGTSETSSIHDFSAGVISKDHHTIIHQNDWILS